MNSAPNGRRFALVAVAAALGSLAMQTAAGSSPIEIPLARGGQPACSIVTVAGSEPDVLLLRAEAAIVDTVRRWSGVSLPVVRNRESAQGPAIVLATLEQLRRWAPGVEERNPAILPVAFMDDHGFVCVPANSQEGARLYVVARSPRGVFNGAIHVSESCIDGPREALRLQTAPIARSPQLPGRAAYTLTIWKHEQLYMAADWEKIFDSFARDGFERIYFWISGHFPSEKFPQTYKVANGRWDTTRDSAIASLADQRQIIRYGKSLGMKVYLGGALGAWVGTRFLTNERPETMKTPQPEGAESPRISPSLSLCPSHPDSRQALIEYYREMFNALPEADGLYIESADEFGACGCDSCVRPVDAHGSRQFGQSQISLLQEIARAVWRTHPHARFCYTIGYRYHKSDPAYYRMIQQMSDPRFEWMEPRDNWKFPGPNGTQIPASHFSRRILRWKPYYKRPLEELVADANRVAVSGFYGSVLAFEPGYSTAWFYKEIPLPTGLLPHVLTAFAFRELTWEPTLSIEDLKQRVQARFFGADAPRHLGADFWHLRDLLRDFSPGKPRAEHWQALAEIEQRAASAGALAGPKTREGLDLITRAITDARLRVK